MKHFSRLSLIVFFAGFYACTNEEEPQPSPLASFTVLTVDGTVGAPITFTNTSTNAEQYIWNFGDGSPESKEESPSHAYDEEGSYQVRLTAYSADGQESANSIILVIKYRKLHRFWFESSKVGIPHNMILYMGELDNPENSYAFSFVTGITPGNLPAGGALPVQSHIQLTNKDWLWMIIDNKEPLDVLDNSDKVFFSAVVNPCLVGNSVDGVGDFFITETEDAEGNTTDNFVLRIEYLLY